MKTTFLAFLAFMITYNIKAQDISFGAKAGANFASISGDLTEDIDGRTSFNAGVVANIGISEKFSIQPELVYSAQGGTANIEGEDFTIKLDYINVPVLADFNIVKGLSIQAGPQIGFNITSEVDADGGESSEIESENIEFSLAAGAQYKLDQGLFFQARYGLGITDTSDFLSRKNNVFSLSIGYFFN
ncbi:porin family protein [uncultured Dokdonia sp.]|uniref:porin family protein n=1 Tax=uncultured Dokdonia sp. TaxID=575653 RepID=UPI0026198683|nr:porin family protein [uncultured Dokdonia sp.]